MNLPLAVITMLWTMGALSVVLGESHNSYFIKDQKVYKENAGKPLCSAINFMIEKEIYVFDIVEEGSTFLNPMRLADMTGNQAWILQALRERNPDLLNLRTTLSIRFKHRPETPSYSITPEITRLLEWPRLISREKEEIGQMETSITVYHYISPTEKYGYVHFNETGGWVTGTKFYQSGDSELQEKLRNSYFGDCHNPYLMTKPILETGVGAKCLIASDIKVKDKKETPISKDELVGLAQEQSQYRLRDGIRYTKYLTFFELETIPSGGDTHSQSYETMMQSRAVDYFASRSKNPSFITFEDYSGKTVIYRTKNREKAGSLKSPPLWKPEKSVEGLESADEYNMQSNAVQLFLRRAMFLKIMETEKGNMTITTNTQEKIGYGFSFLNHKLDPKLRKTDNHYKEINASFLSQLHKLSNEYDFDKNILIDNLYVKLTKVEEQAGECIPQEIVTDGTEEGIESSLNEALNRSPPPLTVTVFNNDNGISETIRDNNTNTGNPEPCINVRTPKKPAFKSFKELVKFVKNVISRFKRTRNVQATQQPHNP